MSKVRIVIADDHGVVRDGLKILIDAQSDLEVVGQAEDGQAALAMIAELAPDIAIIDISMPLMNGIELVSRLRSVAPNTKALVLTANEDHGYMQQFLKLGVYGYLLKRSAASELIHAIRQIATGERYFDQLVVSDMLAGMSSNSPLPLVASEDPLSDRETEVLRLIAQGHSNKEIAAQLDISAKTVETYKTRSMRKLGLRGRADIVRYAVSQSWLKE